MACGKTSLGFLCFMMVMHKALNHLVLDSYWGKRLNRRKTLISCYELQNILKTTEASWWHRLVYFVHLVHGHISLGKGRTDTFKSVQLTSAWLKNENKRQWTFFFTTSDLPLIGASKLKQFYHLLPAPFFFLSVFCGEKKGSFHSQAGFFFFSISNKACWKSNFISFQFCVLYEAGVWCSKHKSVKLPTDLKFWENFILDIP